MRRQLRYFGALLRANISVTIAYRGDFMLMQLGNLVVPMISLLVWQAVLASGASLPVDRQFLVAYFLLVAVVDMLTSTWVAFYLAESIRNGSLNLWLVRPTSTHVNGISNNLGEKAIKVLMLVPYVAVLSVLLSVLGSADQQLRLPTGFGRWLLFAIAVIIAAAIKFALDVLIGSLGFWFEDVSGFLRAMGVIIPVLSGAVVPLALLPAGWQPIGRVQPFRFMLSYPMEVLLGDGGPVYAGFIGQVIWLVIIAGAAALVWRLGLRSYSAAGA